MGDEQRAIPLAINAAEAALRLKPTIYPAPFAARVAGRQKRPLGDVFGLTNFGVNLTRLPPGCISALQHRHARQDEFVYVLDGAPMLVTDEGTMRLGPGMCAGFSAGGRAHHLVNDTDRDVVILEVGDRTPGDRADYPLDDLVAEGNFGEWRITHKDGTPY